MRTIALVLCLAARAFSMSIGGAKPPVEPKRVWTIKPPVKAAGKVPPPIVRKDAKAAEALAELQRSRAPPPAAAAVPRGPVLTTEVVRPVTPAAAAAAAAVRREAEAPSPADPVTPRTMPSNNLYAPPAPAPSKAVPAQRKAVSAQPKAVSAQPKAAPPVVPKLTPVVPKLAEPSAAETPAAPAARKRVSPEEIIARAYERAGQAPPPRRPVSAPPAPVAAAPVPAPAPAPVAAAPAPVVTAPAPAPAPAPLPEDMAPPPRDASLADLAAAAMDNVAAAFAPPAPAPAPAPAPLPEDMAPPPRDASLADLSATTTTAPRAAGVGRMLVPEAGGGPPARPEPKTLVPQVDSRAAAAPLMPPAVETYASDTSGSAWAAVVGGGAAFDPPSIRDLSPEDFQKQWAQNIIEGNARRKQRGALADRVMGSEPAAPQKERPPPPVSSAARALMETFDGRLGRVTVAMKAEAAQMSAVGVFSVGEHAPQRDGRYLLKLLDGAAELVVDAARVVDITYEDRGVLGLTVVVSGRNGAFMLATLEGGDAGARDRFFELAD